MKYRLFALLLIMTAINSCGGSGSQNAKAQDTEKGTSVLVRTTAGDIRLKLYDDTPFHRDNFIKLVEEHYYDSLLFHRVIRDFMVQAGDPDSRNAQKHEMLGQGGPGYTIPAEFVYPKHFHKRGVLSAARQSDQVNPQRSSSGSQFYIVTGKKYRERDLMEMEEQLDEQESQHMFNMLCMEHRDSIVKMNESGDSEGLRRLTEDLNIQLKELKKKNGSFHFNREQVEAYTTDGGAPFLDGQYTVFGEVTDGMDIVDKIQKVGTDAYDRPLKDVRILSMEIIR